MRANQVKCRTCPQVVEDTAMFCPNCGGSEFERIDTEPNPKADLASDLGKLCPKCKTRNEVYAVLCACGEQLTEQTASGQSGAQPHLRKAAPKLWLVVGTQSIECRHGDILGREGTLACDLFRSIQTVSRKHVAVEFRGDQWFLVNLPLASDRYAAKITEVDGKPLQAGESIALSKEHNLRMSSRCEIRLRVEETCDGL